MATGSHVVWGGTPLTGAKRIAGSVGPKVTWFGVGNRRPGGKKDRGLRGAESHVVWGGKLRIGGKRIAGSESKVQIRNRGGPYWKTQTGGMRQKKTPCWKNKNDLIVFLGCYKRERGPEWSRFPRDRVPSPNRRPRGGMGPREEEEVLQVVGVPSTTPTIHFIFVECSISF